MRILTQNYQSSTRNSESWFWLNLVSYGRPNEYVSSEQLWVSAIFISQVYTFGAIPTPLYQCVHFLSRYEILADTVLVKMYIFVLCVCNFIAEKLNVRQKPSVFGNASETAIGMVGVHTIDFGPLGVFHAMAWSRFRRMRAKNRESADVPHGHLSHREWVPKYFKIANS